jgi:hypothetical protein
MFYIVMVNGCEPYVDIMLNPKSDGAMSFKTRKKAETYAKKNCAWEWQVVEF